MRHAPSQRKTVEASNGPKRATLGQSMNCQEELALYFRELLR